MDMSKDRLRQIIKEEIDDIYGDPQNGTLDDRQDPDALDDEDYEWKSVKAHLQKIHHLAGVISDSMEEPEDVEEWIQEKVAVISAMLHSIQHYQESEKVRVS
jgi:hypothetical protein